MGVSDGTLGLHQEFRPEPGETKKNPKGAPERFGGEKGEAGSPIY